MQEQLKKQKKNKNRLVDYTVEQKKSNRKQGFELVDNRPMAVAQRNLKEKMYNGKGKNRLTVLQKKPKTIDCIQAKFYLNGKSMLPHHLSPIERWVAKYHTDRYAEFKNIKDNPEGEVDLNEWLQQEFHETYDVILKSDVAFEDTLDRERAVDFFMGGPIEPPTATLAYGEESARGALSELRKQPSLARRGSRYFATTPASSFPDDEESKMARAEFEKRGGETLTDVDVLESTQEVDAAAPHNLTDLRFRYPRTDRGSRPSTSDVVSGFVDRVAEVGEGELSIPTPAMYKGTKKAKTKTRNSLYGSNKFQSEMQEKKVAISSVRPGPESESELGGFGYSHRMTDRTEERDGGVIGKTMVLEKGPGGTKMEEGE